MKTIGAAPFVVGGGTATIQGRVPPPIRLGTSPLGGGAISVFGALCPPVNHGRKYPYEPHHKALRHHYLPSRRSRRRLELPRIVVGARGLSRQERTGGP